MKNNDNIKIGILGALGRMGKANIMAVNEKNNMTVGSAIETKGSEHLCKDIGELCGEGSLGIFITNNLEVGLSNCDIVIDFTNPKTTLDALESNKNYKRGFVIGTTGFDDSEMDKIKQYSDLFPIVFSPNFSVGVNLMFRLVENASKLLNIDMDYDLEIIEAHHRHKKDAPSGTALRLLDIASKHSKRDKNNAIYGRKGFTGERKSEDIGMSVIRAGDIVGEHTVMYSTEGERIEITHKASGRSAFSKGAIMSAEFISTKDKGFFSMLDVLNF